MRILIFTHKYPDYLQDATIHGFKKLYGNSAIDYPRKDWLYSDNDINIHKLKRKPFTFFRTLQNDGTDRNNIREKIEENYFDYIIFASIHRQIDLLQEYWPIIKHQKLIFLDGEDHPSLFGYNGGYWKKLKLWLLPKIIGRYPYFKREYTPDTVKYRYYKLLPHNIAQKVKLKGIFQVSFAFPEEKMINHLPEKIKLFPEHIVDQEVAAELGKKSSYAFNSEKEYFEDLQKSKFGITTKRAGWDAMRHYEVAANGAVVCFKDLGQKPDTCAPHGLKDGINCISYNSYKELMNKIDNIDDKTYKRIQSNGLNWVKQNSTVKLAEYIIKTADNFYRYKTQ